MEKIFYSKVFKMAIYIASFVYILIVTFCILLLNTASLSEFNMNMLRCFTTACIFQLPMIVYLLYRIFKLSRQNHLFLYSLNENSIKNNFATVQAAKKDKIAAVYSFSGSLIFSKTLNPILFVIAIMDTTAADSAKLRSVLQYTILLNEVINENKDNMIPIAIGTTNRQ